MYNILNINSDNSWKFLINTKPIVEIFSYSHQEASIIDDKSLKKTLEDGCLLLSLSPETAFGNAIKYAKFYRYKNTHKCPRDKFLQEFLKVCQAIKKMEILDLHSLYLDLLKCIKKDFQGVNLPSCSNLAFVLMRTQSFAALLHRLRTCSEKTFQLGIPWLCLGHLLESAIPTIATSASLWYLSSIMIYYLNQLYTSLLPFVAKLKGDASLEMLQFIDPKSLPQDLLVWLEVTYGVTANPCRSKILSKLFKQASPSLTSNYKDHYDEDLGEVVERPLIGENTETIPTKPLEEAASMINQTNGKSSSPALKKKKRIGDSLKSSSMSEKFKKVKKKTQEESSSNAAIVKAKEKNISLLSMKKNLKRMAERLSKEEEPETTMSKLLNETPSNTCAPVSGDKEISFLKKKKKIKGIAERLPKEIEPEIITSKPTNKDQSNICAPKKEDQEISFLKQKKKKKLKGMVERLSKEVEPETITSKPSNEFPSNICEPQSEDKEILFLKNKKKTKDITSRLLSKEDITLPQHITSLPLQKGSKKRKVDLENIPKIPKKKLKIERKLALLEKANQPSSNIVDSKMPDSPTPDNDASEDFAHHTVAKKQQNKKSTKEKNLSRSPEKIPSPDNAKRKRRSSNDCLPKKKKKSNLAGSSPLPNSSDTPEGGSSKVTPDRRMASFIQKVVRRTDVRELGMKNVYLKVLKKFQGKLDNKRDFVKETIREMVTAARQAYKESFNKSPKKM